MFKEMLTQDTALKRVLFRIFWMAVAGAATSALVGLTDNYSNAAWYPLVLFLVTTIKDIANTNLPNVPSSVQKVK